MSNQYKVYSNKHFSLHYQEVTKQYFLTPNNDPNVVKIILSSKPFYFVNYASDGETLIDKKLYQK